MTNETALRIIAEFMGWGIDPNKVYFFNNQNSCRIRSFDTMRMVLDELRSQMIHYECEPDEEEKFYKKFEPLKLNIMAKLYSGEPTDCAPRLAEAIEWWKSVK